MTAKRTTRVTPPPTTPATNSILTIGSDECRPSAVTDAADAADGLGDATVRGVVLWGDGGESGMTSNRGVAVDAESGRSMSPPASGALAAAVATDAAPFVAESGDEGAALDASLSSDGRASPDVDSQRSRDDSRQGFRSVCDPLSLCGELTEPDGPECTCCLHAQPRNETNNGKINNVWAYCAPRK